ncbi:hypothetical protein PaecuDRAFT_1856 [Paenibacillus curdlanolyticus YK9]|uniref:Uncharacterized protein n=1 Tax=Paenibacillus curdlanolyticus YK9 TaxID=717606 RepID=E0I8A5_9BACL|nr:hypothetical protein PaecuDRAFT_1856 [Paenibacillus curdlanolyticus YK9]
MKLHTVMEKYTTNAQGLIGRNSTLKLKNVPMGSESHGHAFLITFINTAYGFR